MDFNSIFKKFLIYFSFVLLDFKLKLWKKFPLILRYKYRWLVENEINFFLNWKTFSLETFDCNLNCFFLNLWGFALNWYVMIKYPLNMSQLKIFIKILKFFDIIDVITSWEELAVIFAKSNYISDISTKSKLGSNGFILMKMIDYLTIKKVDIIDIFLFT